MEFKTKKAVWTTLVMCHVFISLLPQVQAPLLNLHKQLFLCWKIIYKLPALVTSGVPSLRDPYAHKFIFFSLLLMCLVSICLLDQTKECEGVWGKISPPWQHKSIKWKPIRGQADGKHWVLWLLQVKRQKSDEDFQLQRKDTFSRWCGWR